MGDEIGRHRARAPSAAGCRGPRARRARRRPRLRRGRSRAATRPGQPARTDRTCRTRTCRRCRAGRACPSRSARAWRVPDGGKLAGMRTIVVSMPCCSSTLPERLGPSLSSSTRPAVERELPFAERDEATRRLRPRRRQIRRHRLRIAVDEVEDAVAAGIEAGDERRPGHRALRRDRRAERGEAAPLRRACAKFGRRPRAIRSRVRL